MFVICSCVCVLVYAGVLSVRLCVYLCMCAPVECERAHMWKAEVDTGSLPLLLSTLSFSLF